MKKYNFTAATEDPTRRHHPAQARHQRARRPRHGDWPTCRSSRQTCRSPAPTETMAALEKSPVDLCRRRHHHRPGRIASHLSRHQDPPARAPPRVICSSMSSPIRSSPFFEEVLEGQPAFATFGKYNHRLKLGGIKITHGRFSAGQDRLVHHALSHWRSQRGKKTGRASRAFPVPILQAP